MRMFITRFCEYNTKIVTHWINHQSPTTTTKWNLGRNGYSCVCLYLTRQFIHFNIHIHCIRPHCLFPLFRIKTTIVVKKHAPIPSSTTLIWMKIPAGCSLIPFLASFPPSLLPFVSYGHWRRRCIVSIHNFLFTSRTFSFRPALKTIPFRIAVNCLQMVKSFSFVGELVITIADETRVWWFMML